MVIDHRSSIGHHIPPSTYLLRRPFFSIYLGSVCGPLIIIIIIIIVMLDGNMD